MINTDFYIQQFRDLVSKPSNVVITTHYNPDGDAIGSSLAIYHLLKKLKHKVACIVPNELPAFLKWIPGTEGILIYKDLKDQCDHLIKEAEFIISVDYNSFSRVKYFTDQLTDSKAKKVLIDHHPFPDSSYDMLFSDTTVSSTSELIYNLVEDAEMLQLVDEDIATCLYVGIMTDTGSFSYSCKRPRVFEVTAQLVQEGINVEIIHRLVYDTYSETRMRLLGFCLSSRMKVIPEYHTAYIWLSKADLEKYNYQPGDSEGVVNYPLSIENITMSALFVEHDKRVRISLRSKNDFAVNELARQHFIGGGHKNAAGADSNTSLQEALKFFESLLPGYKEELWLNSLSKI